MTPNRLCVQTQCTSNFLVYTGDLVTKCRTFHTGGVVEFYISVADMKSRYEADMK